MVFKELGKTGEKIPALGLGTWGIGGFETPDYSRDEEMVELLKKAINMGYTHIDTAEYYGGGHTEELIGRAIKDFKREELFIVSKVWPNHLRRDDLLRSLESTLKRLDTDYVDLYLIHWPNPEVPLEETLSAMAEGVGRDSSNTSVCRISIESFWGKQLANRRSPSFAIRSNTISRTESQKKMDCSGTVRKTVSLWSRTLP